MSTCTQTKRGNPELGNNLAAVANRLELLEETLIYRCLERVQLAFHPQLYQNRESPHNPKSEAEIGQTADIDDVFQHSLLGLRLQAHEAMDQNFGRYSVAEEFPFSLASPTIAKQTLNSGLKPSQTSLRILQKMNDLRQLEDWDDSVPPSQADLPLTLAQIRQISQCRGILQYYLQFLAQYCPQTTDIQYGSALEYDVILLQAISRRIHYGSIYIAEIKYCESEALLRPLIQCWQNSSDDLKTSKAVQQQILEKITRAEVEQQILQRVYHKAQSIQLATLPTNPANSAHNLHRHYLEPESLRNFYADCIIPLTKQGELSYLFQRI